MATDKQNEALPTADDLPADCLPIAELLAAWVDGGLQGDEARAVTRHVAHCARCEAESQTLRVLLADLHGALQSDDQGRDPVFWATMAANIDAAIARRQPSRNPACFFHLPLTNAMQDRFTIGNPDNVDCEVSRKRFLRPSNACSSNR